MALQIFMYGNESNFIDNSSGIHSSRTMMLAELRLLLTSCQKSANLKDYQIAVVDENVLLKRTVITRKTSFHRLKYLYLLDTNVLLFRALRDLWDEDIQAQPLIALMMAVARDPILKGTAEKILATSTGEIVTPTMIEEAVNASFPHRYNVTTLASIGRNVISSWQQAGLLSGKLHKVRANAQCGPTSLAYALLLGYLFGARGEMLFQTLWCRLLDAPQNILHEHAIAASQLGWIEYRHMGNVTEIGFQYLLRK